MLFLGIIFHLSSNVILIYYLRVFSKQLFPKTHKRRDWKQWGKCMNRWIDF